MAGTGPATVTEQPLFERRYRLGQQQPEVMVVEAVTALIAVLSVFGPAPPSLHAAVGTIGVRLWGIGMAAVAAVFFAVVARERRHPPRLVVLELAALTMHIVMWAAYVGYVTAVHWSGYTSSLAIGALIGVLLVRASQIVQDIRHPRWRMRSDLIVPDPPVPGGQDAADAP